MIFSKLFYIHLKGKKGDGTIERTGVHLVRFATKGRIFKKIKNIIHWFEKDHDLPNGFEIKKIKML